MYNYYMFMLVYLANELSSSSSLDLTSCSSQAQNSADAFKHFHWDLYFSKQFTIISHLVPPSQIVEEFQH